MVLRWLGAIPLRVLSFFVPTTWSGWIYLLLVGLRFFCAFYGYGYIHPDEWMQSGEPLSWYAAPRSSIPLPWEWLPQEALRSMKALSNYSMLIFKALPWFANEVRWIPGYQLFLLQRANALLRSFMVDLSIKVIFPAEVAQTMLCLFGVSTAATTFLVRPFSNSHEAENLAVTMSLVFLLFAQKNRNLADNWITILSAITIMGAVVEGLFARFTFAIFVLPVALYVLKFLHQLWQDGHRKTAILAFGAQVVSFLSFARNFVESDTLFYTNRAEEQGVQAKTTLGSKWVIAPLNALLYNIKTENVAQHGLHPRWLHVLVNFPLMMGISTVVAISIHAYHLVQQVRSQSVRKNQRPDTENKDNIQNTDSTFSTATDSEAEVIETELLQAALQQNQVGSSEADADTATASSTTQPVGSSEAKARANSVAESGEEAAEWIDPEHLMVKMSFVIILFSLAALSISPHQEPRFLLPLALPSVIILTYALKSPFFQSRPAMARALIGLYGAQHFLQMIFFGFLHQAALLTALFQIDANMKYNMVNMQFDNFNDYTLWRTFQVPRHFVPYRGRGGLYPRLDVWYGDTSAEEVIKGPSQRCSDSRIVAPTWALPLLEEATEKSGQVRLVLEKLFWPHLDTDHLAETLQVAKSKGWKQALGLGMYKVMCVDESRSSLFPPVLREANSEAVPQNTPPAASDTIISSSLSSSSIPKNEL